MRRKKKLRPLSDTWGNMIEVLHVTLMKAMLVFKLFIFNANNSFGFRSS